jgi:hypothetical protein
MAKVKNTLPTVEPAVPMILRGQPARPPPELHSARRPSAPVLGHDPLLGLVALDSLAQRCGDERLDGDALAGDCHPHPVLEVVVHLVLDGACSLPKLDELIDVVPEANRRLDWTSEPGR